MERTDAQLIDAYHGGDEVALDELVRRHLAPVHRFLMRYVGADDADDVAQEAFVKAWKKLRSFDTARTFRPWLFQIAKNTALDLLKRQSRTPVSSIEADEMLAASLADTKPLPSATIDAEAVRLELAYATESLPDIQRQVMEMRYRDGSKLAEIADALGTPLGSVKSWHARALKALKKTLGQRE